MIRKLTTMPILIIALVFAIFSVSLAQQQGYMMAVLLILSPLNLIMERHASFRCQ